MLPESVPPVGDLAGVVLLGGPMGADDLERYPSLGVERELARHATAAGIPVLGICLGHQVLGLALGGQLERGAVAEVGVAPIEVLTDSDLGRPGATPDVLHWHFDNMRPPPGATIVARSDMCPNQAFKSGSALGLQFHLEIDRTALDEWLAVEGVQAELAAAGGSDLVDRFDLADKRMAVVAERVFGTFAASAAARQ